MAKTNTERQRDWRTRQAARQAEVARLTDELAAWKDEARRWGDARKAESASQQAEIAALLLDNERLTAERDEAQAGRIVPPCTVCGGHRENREEEARLWDELSAKARAAGQCIPCLRASYWQSRPKLTRHRDAANCPQARKYAR